MQRRWRIRVHHLAKQRGGRLDHVVTFAAQCERGKASLDDTTRWIVVSESLKGADERDVFVHVVRAAFVDGPPRTDVIIKLQSALGPVVRKEDAIYARAAGHRHVVHRICTVSCENQEARWLHRLSKDDLQRLCRGGGDRIHMALIDFQRGWLIDPTEDVQLLREEPATVLYVMSRWVQGPVRSLLLERSEQVARASDLDELVEILRF